MSDIVERLRSHANWYISCALGNVPDEAKAELEAADLITRLRSELASARADYDVMLSENRRLADMMIAGALERVDAREALFPEMSARIQAEREQARAAAFEEAAGIADAVLSEGLGDETNVSLSQAFQRGLSRVYSALRSRAQEGR